MKANEYNLGGLLNPRRNARPAALGGVPAVETPPPHHRWPAIGPEEEAAVIAALRRGELSVHRRSGGVESFEEAFRNLHESNWVLSTGSGTAALHAAFFGLDLLSGDQVIAPAYTHLSTVIPLLQAHLVPVLCDVESETGNIDPYAIEQHITNRTRAIVITHQYGHPCDMEPILRIAEAHGLRIVEDCSHSHGARWRGRIVGTIGAAGAFSLQAHKAVVAGEGGVLISDDAKLFERAALLGHFRTRSSASDFSGTGRDRFADSGYGMKNRIHPLGAAVAEVQLRKLTEVNERRAAHHKRLAAILEEAPGIRLSETATDVERGGYFRFLCHLDPDLLGGLTAAAVLRAVHMEGAIEVCSGALARPVHTMAIMQTLDDGMVQGGWPRKGPHVSHAPVYKLGDFPVAETLSQWSLLIPAFTWESEDVVEQYGLALVKVAQHAQELADTGEMS